MSNLSNEIIGNVLSQFGIFVSNPQATILDSSSTNIILLIDNKYVVKCKNIESHHGVIHLLDQLLHEVNRIHKKLYLTTRDGNLFVCDNEKLWFVMNYIGGDKFKFGNKEQILSVANYINEIKKHYFYDFVKIKNDLEKIQAPKNDINLIFHSPETFFDSYSKDIKDIISPINCDNILKEVYSLIDAMFKGDSDYSSLSYGLSHGEMQGQNMVFKNNRIKCAIDWDSVGIRPVIFDVAMAICFFCRESRGQFIINEGSLNCFIKAFNELNYTEKCNIFNSMLIGFIPDRHTILSYAIENKHKAEWYLNWSLEAIIQLKKQESLIKSVIGGGMGGEELNNYEMVNCKYRNK